MNNIKQMKRNLQEVEDPLKILHHHLQQVAVKDVNRKRKKRKVLRLKSRLLRVVELQLEDKLLFQVNLQNVVAPSKRQNSAPRGEKIKP